MLGLHTVAIRNLNTYTTVQLTPRRQHCHWSFRSIGWVSSLHTASWRYIPG